MECLYYSECVEEDLLRFIAAVTSELLLVVIVSIALFALFFLDLEIILLSMVLVLNFIVNLGIKIVVDAPRPRIECGIGPGFPSGHAQTAALLAMYISVRNWRLNSFVSPFIFYNISIAWFATFCVAISRIILDAHTVLQVVFGLLIGSCLGFVAYIGIRILLLYATGHVVTRNLTTSSGGGYTRSRTK